MNTEALAKDQAEIINYHRSTGWTIHRSKVATVTFATRPSPRNPDHVWVKAWTGTARVPAWNYTFPTAARAEAAATHLVESTKRSELALQITEVKPKSVIVRSIKVNSSDHGQPGGGRVAPRRYEFFGPEIYCPIDEAGGFNAGPCRNADKPSYRHRCYKWDGKSVYTSSDR